MKKGKLSLDYVIVYISMIVFLVVTISQTYNVSILFNIIYMILLCGYIFCVGNKLNTEKNYRKNITLYIILYFMLLSCLTLFNNRSGLGLINKEHLAFHVNEINLIPFKTIYNFISGKSGLKSAVYNIVGNFIMLIPLSILLFLKNPKYKKIKWQFIVLFGVTCLIEVFQLVFLAGSFDIDDIILNLLGALFFFTLFKKILNLDKLRNLFYDKININEKMLKIVNMVLLIMIIILNLIVCLEYFEDFKTSSSDAQYTKFYLVEREECSENIPIKLLEKNIYFHCVDIYYNTEDDWQMSLSEALAKNYITFSELEDEMEYDDKNSNALTKYYVSRKYNMTMVVCDENNVHFGDEKLSKDDKICIKD